MATKVYAVAPVPGQGPVPFECKAGSAVEAIGRLEKHLHARMQPREPLSVRAYRPPLPEPIATGVIEPAPFRVRFHAPEARGDEGARIRFEVDGRASGELVEIPARYGSQWVARSADSVYDGIGTCKPLTLGEACGEVERMAGRFRELCHNTPARGTAGPERANAMER